MAFRDLSDEENEWLVVELKTCRSIVGMTQKDLALSVGMALQSIKRLEKKGAQPRYSSINKIRAFFKSIGLVCSFSEKGDINVVLSTELIEAINEGGLKEHLQTHLVDADSEKNEN